MGNFIVVPVLTGLLGWGLVAFLSYRIYKRQVRKPAIWKLIVVVFIGIFSFSFNFTMFDALIKVSILPLGFWILYLFYGKKEGWKTYRSYAWLGFWANFIFLAATLMAVPIQHVIYQENNQATYISNINDASLIKIHPSAKSGSINPANFMKHMNHLKEEPILSDQWYQDTFMDSKQKTERFPYQLIGVSPKFGSGLSSIIYIENDGKGILISTSGKQLYFRSDHSLIEGGK